MKMIKLTLSSAAVLAAILHTTIVQAGGNDNPLLLMVYFE